MSGRRSIASTYDSRVTGPRFWVETRVSRREVSRTALSNPFMFHRVTLGWVDLLRGLLHGRLEVTVEVGAPPDLVEDVLELDENYTGLAGSSRRVEWDESVDRALRNLA